MIKCPTCGRLVTFNTYFGAYICHKCGWKNENYNIDRATACTSGTFVLSKSMAEYSNEAIHSVNKFKEASKQND
jgi:hypothetical protein